jgi:hypothetical protein
MLVMKGLLPKHSVAQDATATVANNNEIDFCLNIYFVGE